jgi:hypothetical protein
VGGTSHTAAITACDGALALAPGYVDALNNKGLALQSRGGLDAAQENQIGASEDWQVAVATWTRSLALASEQEVVRAARDALRRLIDSTRST